MDTRLETLLGLKEKLIQCIKDKNIEEVFHLLDSAQSKFMMEPQPYDLYKCNTPYSVLPHSLCSVDDYVNASPIRYKKSVIFACQEPKFEYNKIFLDFIKAAKIETVICLKNDSTYFDTCKLIFKRDIDFQGKHFLTEELVEFDSLQIRRVTCVAWEDLGILTNSQMLFLYDYCSSLDGTTQLIHCHAGIGRTGTFIMYKFLMDQVPVSVEIFVDTLIRLRNYRANLVETKEQLLMLIDAFIPS